MQVNKNKYNFNRKCDNFKSYQRCKEGLAKKVEILEHTQVNPNELDDAYEKFKTKYV